MRIAYVIGNENPQDPDPDLDIPFAKTAAKELRIDLVFANWNDEQINWSDFDAAVIRSTWDYVPVRDRFLKKTKEISNETKLFNPHHVMSWNTDKKYLLDLEAKGVPIIPTKFVHNIEEAKDAISWAFDIANSIAIKPTVGAGARLAGKANSAPEALTFVEEILKVNRVAMIQPYVSSVDEEGEKAIIIIDGQISHAARKVPALTVGGHGDAAGALEVTDEIGEIVRTVSEAIKEWDDLLFARVDVVRLDNKLVLMELELTEPWLFMQFRPEAGIDLFKALEKRISRE
jgi:glutathione synthase/RimK-type ligase-like ATP-grasp enzyme